MEDIRNEEDEEEIQSNNNLSMDVINGALGLPTNSIFALFLLHKPEVCSLFGTVVLFSTEDYTRLIEKSLVNTNELDIGFREPSSVLIVVTPGQKEIHILLSSASVASSL